MSIVMDDPAADMPEPSPLFWDHLSDRVRGAVAAEDRPRHSWPGAAPWWRRVLPLAAVAVASLLIAVALGSRIMAPRVPVPAGAHAALPPEATAADLRPADILDSAPDDASLTLVASLAEHLDLDGAGEAGLAPRESAEHAVTQMSDDDLRELRRVLKEELARPGA
jgi:hypothetical protein